MPSSWTLLSKYVLIALIGAILAIWASLSPQAMSIRNALSQLPKRITVAYNGSPLLSSNAATATIASATLTSRAAYSTPAAVAKGATRFTYRIAASYSGKGQRLNPIRNTYEFNSVNISAIFEGPQGAAKATKKKRPASGQDSFFVGNVGDTGGVAFGVADGVGGWVESGIDPADFAHSLCNYMGKAAARFPAGFKTQPMAPQELLQIGFEKVMKDDSVPGGGSTACIATANVEGRLDPRRLRLPPTPPKRRPLPLPGPNPRLQHALPALQSPQADARPGSRLRRDALLRDAQRRRPDLAPAATRRRARLRIRWRLG
ncbi:MAG: hypothetical protein Q9157_008901 [Trypethelium eluteriae]